MPAVRGVQSLLQLSLDIIPGIVKHHAASTAQNLVDAWWRQKQSTEKKTFFKFQNRQQASMLIYYIDNKSS